MTLIYHPPTGLIIEDRTLDDCEEVARFCGIPLDECFRLTGDTSLGRTVAAHLFRLKLDDPNGFCNLTDHPFTWGELRDMLETISREY